MTSRLKLYQTVLVMKLTALERKELVKLEKTIPHKGVAIRIRIVLALDLGYSMKEVSEILLLDENTVSRWKKLYEKSKLLSDWLGSKQNGYQGKLTHDQEEIIANFVNNGVITDCQEIVNYIKDTFDISYSVDGVTKILHRLNFVYKKTVIVPGKLDPTKQKQFLKEYKDLKKNLKITEKILFLDGVHPTHNTQKLRCWIKRGVDKQIKTNTGRDRLNIQGALDVNDNLDLTSGSFKTLNAITTLEFFDQIQAKYNNLTKIYCVVDNARYYKNKDVTTYLDNKSCKIRLIFLPAYSPNLNLIERLWKYLRQKIIGTKYREKFKEFKEDINYFLNHTSEYPDLKSFIGTKPHLITT